MHICIYAYMHIYVIYICNIYVIYIYVIYIYIVILIDDHKDEYHMDFGNNVYKYPLEII